MIEVIAVQCSDVKHRGRTVKVDTFRLATEESGVRRWIGDHERYTTHHAGTTHLSTRSRRIDSDGASSYEVRRLHCNLCPRSVPARNDRFEWALDKLADEQRAAVELRVLGAIVSKQ